MKYKKNLIAALIIVSCTTGQSQEIRKNESLRKQIWDLAGYNMDYPEHEIGVPLEKLDMIDDTSGAGYLEDVGNGYLYIRDGGPPCGCYYDHIVGAFKTSDGYVFLKNTYDYCPQTYVCSPSRNWEDILPEEINPDYFFKKGEMINSNLAFFYLEVGIPRYGRDVTFTTKFIPFGMNDETTHGAYNGHLLFTNKYIQENTGKDYSFIKNCIPDSMIERKTYSHDDLKNLTSLIYNQKNHNIYPWTSRETELAIMYLYEIYKEYQKVDFQTITMTWNMEIEHFEIKNIEKHKKIKGFLNFLRNGSYWMLVC